MNTDTSKAIPYGFYLCLSVFICGERFWVRIGTEDPGMNEITTMEQMEAAVKASTEHPVFIFKHSTACPVSAGALRRANEYIAKCEAAGTELPPFYLIKVIEARPVSNALAQKVGVQHASPQLLLLDQGRAAWHTSHFDINGENIEKALHAQT